MTDKFEDLYFLLMEYCLVLNKIERGYYHDDFKRVKIHQEIVDYVLPDKEIKDYDFKKAEIDGWLHNFPKSGEVYSIPQVKWELVKIGGLNIT